VLGGVAGERSIVTDEDLRGAVTGELLGGLLRAAADDQDGEAAAHGGQRCPGEGDGAQRGLLDRTVFCELCDDWDERYTLGKAYQLSHSLIAFGRGEIFGQGLGSSVEKLHYLPEAHTDFLLAVIGEELGFVGVACVIFAFFWISRRLFHVGRQAIALDRVFAGLFAQGVGIWFGGQAFINMGVNLGVLPTKGLTLPLMSYGGSAIVMNLVALAIVLRIDIENRQLMRGGRA
jgi:cell division protein FtsW (lipid II flippase)